MFPLMIQILCYVTIAAVLISCLSAIHAERLRRQSAFSLSDLQNCKLLLSFLRQTFRGSTIGNLRMDDLANSLENLLKKFSG